MTASTQLEITTRDPLSEVTRKERRLLLGASVIGVAVVKTGLVPQKITTLGVEFSSVNKEALLYLIALIVAYFLCAFFVYSASDLITWRLEYQSEWKDLYRRRKIGDKAKSSESEQAMKEHFRGGRVLSVLSHIVLVMRVLFDFLLPLIVGIYAIASLLYYKVS